MFPFLTNVLFSSDSAFSFADILNGKSFRISFPSGFLILSQVGLFELFLVSFSPTFAFTMLFMTLLFVFHFDDAQFSQILTCGFVIVFGIGCVLIDKLRSGRKTESKQNKNSSTVGAAGVPSRLLSAKWRPSWDLNLSHTQLLFSLQSNVILWKDIGASGCWS